MKNNIDGILIINKPSGITSRDVVNKLQKILNTKKIGHTGTLDPLATGVLICLIGKYTKLSDYLTSKEKTYKVNFKLGIQTDSLDITGKILKTSNKLVSNDEIINTINSFKKTYMQEVPAYSAIKLNGKKLYEYARNNIDISLPKKEVTIYNIENIDIKEEISFITKVSKGTYIRSLIRDIGYKLGTYAVMTKLNRITQGKFTIDDSYTLEDIEKGNYKLLTIEDILNKDQIIDIDEEIYNKVNNGVKYPLNNKNDIVLLRYNNKNICLYKKEDKNFRMYLKF